MLSVGQIIIYYYYTYFDEIGTFYILDIKRWGIRKILYRKKYRTDVSDLGRGP